MRKRTLRLCAPWLPRVYLFGNENFFPVSKIKTVIVCLSFNIFIKDEVVNPKNMREICVSKICAVIYESGMNFGSVSILAAQWIPAFAGMTALSTKCFYCLSCRPPQADDPASSDLKQRHWIPAQHAAGMTAQRMSIPFRTSAHS